MRMTTLGRTDLKVSEICLGSMTWGTQNTEADGHAQIDMALERGINFIDTAEIYPVNPVAAETIGRTEEIIGTWLAKSGRRDDVILATKIGGKGQTAVRDGAPISAETIRVAFESSLRRLQTDRIDLYQLHWPNRGSYHFRQSWNYDPSGIDRDETLAHMREVLELMAEYQAKGVLGHFGLSNETAWGTAMWLRLSEEMGLPRVASIQNEYSLLCRYYDLDLGELGAVEDVTLLAYSPLGAGLLSGKYRGGAVPEGSRMAINNALGGRNSPRAHPAVEAYKAVADKHGLSLAAMSVAWCTQRPFPTIPIIGATSLTQLEEVLGAETLELSQEVLDDIAAAHKEHPLPY